ncbi:MAG: haloacid dehalogenase [Armatimonadota bacterium]|nr:MAG: haloacid dehalogenase [Armatimonadota bacterium]GIV21302.1 MAG: haloacid dehalogenase [Armatimonadota bacterium]GIV22024.1 MAG: haloacid dehalogenase [Armatimonadota bacterium]
MTVVLDADDTLWRTQSVYERIKTEFKQMLGQIGIYGEDIIQQLDDLDRARVPYRGLRPERFIESLVITYTILATRHGIPFNPGVEAAIYSFRHLLDAPPELYPETIPVLEELRKRGHLLVLYSAAGDMEHQNRRIDLSGIRGYFHHVVVTATKDRDSFLRLLEMLDAQHNPQRVVMVGNSYQFDILPALQCGARGILIDRGDWQATQQVEIDPSVPVLSSLEGLPDLIIDSLSGK